VCPFSLDSKEHVYCRYGVFKVRVSRSLTRPARRPVPQSSTAWSTAAPAPRSGEPRSRRGRHGSRRAQIAGRPKPSQVAAPQQPAPKEWRTAGGGQTALRACRSWSSGIPRKEVIQPHLPLRLPCYDFTPIIDPTFDGCLLRRG